MDTSHVETRAVHPPVVAPVAGTPLGVPIYQGHLFAYEDAGVLGAAFADPEDAFFYGRYGNPTVRSLEEAIADLEGGARGLASASGMATMNTVFMGLLRSGDHVVAQRTVYGGTYVLLRDLAARWGVEVTYVSGTDTEEVRAALRPHTRMLVLETVANPTTQVADLPALISVVRDTGVLTVVDNTFTPLLCRPLELGADIAAHSATKYLGGHSDVLAGVAAFADAQVHHTVWKHATTLGSTAEPHSAWLTLRGLATLPLRFERHCANALTLARRLAEHPAVAHVNYPGLASHPQHELARRLLGDRFGAILSMELAGGREAGRTFIESIQLAKLVTSLGDVKTLALHPASTSHRGLDPQELAAAGIGEGMVRISVGIEHADDLWADFEQALAKAG